MVLFHKTQDHIPPNWAMKKYMLDTVIILTAEGTYPRSSPSSLLEIIPSEKFVRQSQAYKTTDFSGKSS